MFVFFACKICKITKLQAELKQIIFFRPVKQEKSENYRLKKAVKVQWTKRSEMPMAASAVNGGGDMAFTYACFLF